MEKKNINGELLTISEAYKKNERLIWSIAHKFKGPMFPLEDLFMMGCEGFVKAFDRFDYDTYPVKFATYAVPIITGAIQRQVRDNGYEIKFSRSIKALAFSIIKEGMIDESRDEISKKFSTDIKRINDAFIFLANRNLTRLESPTNIESDGKDTTIGETIGDKRYFDDTDVDVQEFLSSLDEKTKRAIEMTMEGMIQRDIAKILGVSQVQVSRYIKKAKPLAEEFFGIKNHVFQKEEEPDVARKREVQGDLELAKRLLATTDKSIGEILKETHCLHATVSYWEKKLRTEERKETDRAISNLFGRQKEDEGKVKINTDIVNAYESNRELIVEESDIDFLYSIRNKNLSPSDLHVLFTQIGHAAASSGVKKLDVSLKVSVVK